MQMRCGRKGNLHIRLRHDHVWTGRGKMDVYMVNVCIYIHVYIPYIHHTYMYKLCRRCRFLIVRATSDSQSGNLHCMTIKVLFRSHDDLGDADSGRFGGTKGCTGEDKGLQAPSQDAVFGFYFVGGFALVSKNVE